MVYNTSIYLLLIIMIIIIILFNFNLVNNNNHFVYFSKISTGSGHLSNVKSKFWSRASWEPLP